MSLPIRCQPELEPSVAVGQVTRPGREGQACAPDDGIESFIREGDLSFLDHSSQVSSTARAVRAADLEDIRVVGLKVIRNRCLDRPEAVVPDAQVLVTD